jgi:branched-chain amino acid transport system permease protein
MDWSFSFLLVTSGLLIGLMYALIALGFVLVYKATDAINFAQGEFVMAPAIVAAVVAAAARSFWLGVLAALAVMVGFSFLFERAVLRPLLGRPVIAVIMATIGLAAILRGVLPLIFGVDTRTLELPLGDDPIEIGSLALQPAQVGGAAVAVLCLIVFTWFFRFSRIGVSMRAMADDQQVASAMGVNISHYFTLAWAMAGVVSALGGVLWGAMLGVDVQLALVGLKVFPVVILGGLDSVGGAILGGLIVGVVENLVAGYFDPLVGGGTKDFIPYVLMVIALMIRPYGMFGTRRIERV